MEDEIEDAAARGLETHIKNPHYTLARNAALWKKFLAEGTPLAKVQAMMTDSAASHRTNLNTVKEFLNRTDAGKARILAKYKGNPNEVQEFATAYEATIALMEAAPRSTLAQIETECNRIIIDTPHVRRRIYG
jgi:hypothetical protein